MSYRYELVYDNYTRTRSQLEVVLAQEKCLMNRLYELKLELSKLESQPTMM